VTLNQRLEEFLKARPDIWIDGEDLGKIAGKYAWRSRVSDLRLKRGMVILNAVVNVTDAQGKPFKRSLYRYVPEVPRGQATLFEAAQI
jgi:hypothetical protein